MESLNFCHTHCSSTLSKCWSGSLSKLAKAVLLTVLSFLILESNIFAQYTLTDDDVVVIDGIIDNCSYYFTTDIIIPDTLDGQVVRGVAHKSYNNGVFQFYGLTSVVFPSSIESVGSYAFRDNKLIHIDLSACSKLTHIGFNAFHGNNLISLDLSACTSLRGISDHAFDRNNDLEDIDFSGCIALAYIGLHSFSGNKLTNLDLSPCSSLEHIEGYAFSYNNLTHLDLSGCSALKIIDERAFRSNNLTDLDLSGCSSLTYIGAGVFEDNDFSTFILPTPEIPGLHFNHWFDEDSITFAGGEIINNLNSEYFASFSSTYTVSLTISDGSLPIQGAEVNLTGYGSLLTDLAGQVTFSDVLPAEDLSFTVNANGFYEANGTVSIEDENESINVALTLITGLSNKSGSDFSLYPNPAHDLLHIFIKEPGVLVIMDVCGQIVLTLELSGGLEEISVAQLTPGLYLFKLQKENDTFLRKVIVK